MDRQSPSFWLTASQASTTASQSPSLFESSALERMQPVRNTSNQQKLRTITTDKMSLITSLSREISTINWIQAYASFIHKQSKLALHTQASRQNMQNQIQKGYAVICLKKLDGNQQKETQQFEKAQIIKYDRLIPNSSILPQQQMTIFNNAKITKNQIQKAMVVLYNLRSFLFGIQPQQELIIKLIQDLYNLSKLLNPQQVELILESTCNELNTVLKYFGSLGIQRF